MSVNSVGGNAAQLWELLQDSRTGQAGSGDGAPSYAASAASAAPSATTATTAASATSTDSASDAATKVIADLKSFFIALQSENGVSAPASTADAANATTATNTADATTASSGHVHHGHHHGGGASQDAIAQLLQQYDSQSGAPSGENSTTAISA